MSLDKAIKRGKEHRKHYYRSLTFDTTCRPHGSCPWCARARRWNYIKRKKFAAMDLKEYCSEVD